MLPAEVRERARAIRALVLDVDGVLTDGGMYVLDSGESFKRFDVKDGLGLARLLDSGFVVALLSSDDSPGIRHRAEKLGVKDVYTGVSDKSAALKKFLDSHGLAPDVVAFVGDDLTDRGVMKEVGLAICPSDAVEEVRRIAHWVTERPGGRGAVREVADALLSSRCPPAVPSEPAAP